MADMSRFMSSRFLKPADIRETGPIKARIVAIEIGAKFDKPEATLDDGSILSLNATNCTRLGHAYGSDSDDWLDKEVELSVGMVDYQGKPTETILVKSISPATKKKAPVKPQKRGNVRDLDDEIPF